MLRSNVASSEIASEASLRNYIDRPSREHLKACSDVLSDVMSGDGHISHCNGSVIPSNLHVPVNSSFIHKIRLEQFVYYLSCEKTCVFL